jgi:hypothetical protein
MQTDIGTPLVDGMKALPLREEPFAFKVMRESLDPALFEAARSTFPTPDRMRPKVESRADSRYSDRRLTVDLESCPDLAAAEGRAVWREIADFFLRSSELVATLREVFGPLFADELEARFGQRPTRFRLNSELVYDRTGFALLPHTDASNKAATLLTYFAEPGDPVELGTVLFAPKDEDLADPGGRKFWRPDQFRAVARVPYLPNLSVAFARHRTSFHGVMPTTSTTPRRLIQTSLIAAVDP